MSTCEAGSCGISCAGTCGCSGSGDNCLCACYPVMLTEEGAYDGASAGAESSGPVVSGVGIVRDGPFDIDFKGFPLAALATIFLPPDMHDDVCIPVAVAQNPVTRTERGVGLAEFVRSLGLRLTGRATS